MNKKIKVGFITDDIDRKAMGTALYMQELIKTFATHFNDQVELIFIYREGKCKVPVCDLARRLPIKTFKLPKYTGITSFVRFFFTSKEEFDIIHFPRPKLFPFFWKLKSKKFVVTFHDAPIKGEWIYRTPANYIFEWFIKLWGKYHIDAAIGDADYSARIIGEHYGIDHNKIFGIKLAGTIDRGPLTASEISKQGAYLKEKYNIVQPYILQVGRLVPHKNVHRVVKAFDIFKNRSNARHKLVILGGRNHSSSYDKIVDAEINNSSFKKDIYIAPYIESEDMAAVYALSDFFVQAGTFDGFSIPIVDALKMGVPVLTSNRSVFPEIVGNAAILVDPFNPEDIATGMEKLASDPNLKKQLSELGIKKSLEYNWIKTAEETIGVYKNVLNVQ